MTAQLGKYRLLARLGSGGMAEVLLGRLDGPGGFVRHVAIKKMRRELTKSAEFVELFLEEARTASRLRHRNICEVNELEAEGAEPYMVMEYLEGVPVASVLSQQLRDPNAWELRAIVGIVAQACEGLHHAHDALDADGQPLHLVHRDVSPPNLFLTEQGIVKVLDFGISKSRASVVRTMTGQIRGKFAYMSPEQLRGEPLDRRSDVFSLGIVLAELLTGQRLFRRVNRLEVFKAIVRDPMPSVRELRADLPDLVVEVADRALGRDRDERFDNARALGNALSGAVRALGGPAPPSALAELVRRGFAAELDARRELYLHPPGRDVEPPIRTIDSGAATYNAAPAEAAEATAVDLAPDPGRRSAELAASLPPELRGMVLGSDDTD